MYPNNYMGVLPLTNITALDGNSAVYQSKAVGGMRKQKSRKQKTRKQKSRKQKTRKQKTRK
jgi:hypothetical protein